MAGISSARVRDALRRRGVVGLLLEAEARAQRAVYLHEEHLWYELPLDGAVRFHLPAGSVLKRVESEDLTWIVGSNRDVDETRRLLSTGQQLWLLSSGDIVLFSAWVFHGSTPVLAVPGGQLQLADGVVCIEDIVTAPAYRGRGIARDAISNIGQALLGEGSHLMIAKVEVANRSSHRMFAKLRPQQTALMELTRILGRRRVSVRDARGTTGALLAAALRGRRGCPRSWRRSRPRRDRR